MAAALSAKDAAPTTVAPTRHGDGSRALLEAFQNPFVEELLEVVFASDCFGSLLKSAVSMGKTGLLERLLKRFASGGAAPRPAAATASICTELSAALVEAARKGDAPSLQLLLDAFTSSSSSSSPAAAAAAGVMQLLDARDGKKRTALMLAARGGHAACTQLLLGHAPAAAAAQVAALDACDYNAAMHAAEHGHAACLQLLLAHSPDAQVKAVSDRDVGGCNALMLAAQAGHAPCLQLLLAHSPDVQVTAESGDYWGCWSALMFAVGKNHTACAQLLLAHARNAQLQYRHTDTGCPLQCAACYAAEDCLRLLLALGPSQHQLDAALHGTCRFLERKRQEGGSELGLTKCVELLLAGGAMLGGTAGEALLEIVRPINQSLAARALVPDIANEAMVGLALAAGRGRRRPDGEGEGAAEPEAKAACSGP